MKYSLHSSCLKFLIIQSWLTAIWCYNLPGHKNIFLFLKMTWQVCRAVGERLIKGAFGLKGGCGYRRIVRRGRKWST